MATRFYLPASGTPPLAALAVNTNWELTTGLVRLPTFTAKQNTALANSNRTWPATATQQWAWYQYQSEQLLAAYTWATTDTVSMVLGKLAETSTAGDTHLAYIVRVVSADGSVVRGVIGLMHATSTEFPLTASAATRIHSALTTGATAFSSQIGDRIIIEIGVHGVTPAAESIQMRVGDPTASGDFALTAALTTDLCPWVELSRTVSLGTPPVNLIVDDSSHSHIIDNVTITQSHSLSLQDSFHSSIVDNIDITQVNILTIQDSFHPHISDNVDVVQQTPAVNLILDDSRHSHVIDNITVTQAHSLAVSDSIHSHIADNVVVTQSHSLVLSDSLHSHITDNVAVTQAHSIIVSDSRHSNSVDSVLISQVHNIVVSDARHSSIVDGNLVILQEAGVTTIVVHDAIHSHIVDNITITQVHNIILSDPLHSHITDNVVITGSHNISASDSIHSHVVDNISVTQLHNIQIADPLHSHIVDNVTVSVYVPPVDLIVYNSFHSHISENIVVSITQIASVRNSYHSHSSDIGSVIQDHILSVSGSLHSHISSSIIVNTTVSESYILKLGFKKEPKPNDDGNTVYTLIDPRLDRKDKVQNRYKLVALPNGIFTLEAFMYRLPEFVLATDSYYGVIRTNKDFLKIYGTFLAHSYRLAEWKFPPQYYDTW